MKHRIHHTTLEHERVTTIGFGDISSWSRACSSFQRPTGKGGQREPFRPITDKSAVRPISAAITPAPAHETIVLPHVTRHAVPEIGDGVISEQLERKLAISADFWRRFQR